VFFPIRYAEDFVILVAGSEADATQERAALADYLQETMGLELSLTKTHTTALRVDQGNLLPFAEQQIAPRQRFR
jgi:hypothetical protein